MVAPTQSPECAYAAQLRKLLHDRQMAAADRLMRRVLVDEPPETWIDHHDAPELLAALARGLSRSCYLGTTSCQLDRLRYLLPDAPHAVFTHVQYRHIALFLGIHAFHHDRYTEALDPLRTAYAIAREPGIQDVSLQIACCLFLSVVQRKLGRHEKAIKSAHDGMALLGRHNPQSSLRYVFLMSEAWAEFRRGNTTRTLELLDAIEAASATTNDPATLGHIRQVRARLARRQGDFAESSRLLTEAIALYDVHKTDDRNLARAYNDAAYTLIMQSRHQDGNRSSFYERVQRNLDIARALLKNTHNDRRLASISNHWALLHLERGEYTSAIERAREAHDQAVQHHYKSIASYARVIECRAYLAEHPVDRERKALRLALEAWQYVKDSDDHRRVTRALLCRANAHLHQDPPEVAHARRCVADAAKVLDPRERDDLYHEFQGLQERLTREPASEEHPLWAISREKALSQPAKDTIAELVDALVVAGMAAFGNKNKVEANLHLGQSTVNKALARIAQKDVRKRPARDRADDDTLAEHTA
jgi:tetratricopeptide (TPR) repeat protein